MSVEEKYSGGEYPKDPHSNQDLPDEPSAGELADNKIEAIDKPGPGKSSPAEPPDLNNLMTVQRPQTLPVDALGGEESGTDDAAEPSYKISSAEPDFSVYGSDTLETGEMPVIEEEKESGWKTTWAIVREVGETVILTLVIFLLIQMVVRNFRVVGTSMINNLHDGQYLIIDKLSYSPWVSDYLGIGGPQRGDVIVFVPPRHPDEDYVKRIIGMPGEKVQVVKGQVYVNDELLSEPFEPRTGTYTMPEPIIVPDGQVFVLGDNRNNSNDSHNWGPLPIENIVGRAWLSYWPPDEWGTIPRDIPTEQATLKYVLSEFIPSANAQNP